MNPGEFDILVTVEQPSETLNGHGDTVEQRAVLCRVWVKMEYLSGRELESAQQRYAQAEVRFETWFAGDIRRINSKCTIQTEDEDEYEVLGWMPKPGHRSEVVWILTKRRAD